MNGVFWLPGQADDRLPGKLDISGRWPRITLYGTLVETMELFATLENGEQHWGPKEMGNENLLVHGALGGAYGRVTLTEASLRRTSDTFGFGPAEQVLEGRHCLLGANLDEEELLFHSAVFRLRSIEHWLPPKGLSVSAKQDGGVSISYEAPALDDASPIQDLEATLNVASHWSLPRPTVTGASVKTSSHLKIIAETSMNLEEVMETFVAPFVALGALVSQDESPVVAMQVLPLGQERWLEVHGPTIEANSNSGDPADPLVRRPAITSEALANWVATYRRLAPVPSIVADALSRTTRTVESQLLQLATAAEGLHRRLNPDVRALSDGQVVSGIAALASADMDGAVRERLTTALDVYLWDYSFPQRLNALAEDVEQIAPGLTGRSNRWKHLVSNARNSLAHSTVGASADVGSIHEMATTVESLKWLLRVRLLMELPLEAGVLTEALQSSHQYANYLGNARTAVPKVWQQ